MRCLLRGHAPGRGRGGSALVVERHQRRIEARDLERRIEHAVEELVELDRGPEVAQEPVAPALPLGALERFREVAAEIVHARAHVVDGLDEPVVPLARLAAADDLERDDAEPQKSRRRDDRADGSARDVRFPHLPRTAL